MCTTRITSTEYAVMRQPQRPPKRPRNCACKSRMRHDEPPYYEERHRLHYSPTTKRRRLARTVTQEIKSDLEMSLVKKEANAVDAMVKTIQKEICASRDKICKQAVQHETDY